jgi:hypothetical protein
MAARMKPDLFQRFDLYCKRAEELRTTSFAQSELFKHFSINIKGNQTAEGFELRIAMQQPSPDELRSYLMVLRHFVANREPTQFRFISREIMRTGNNPSLIACAKLVRDQFAHVYRDTSFPLIVNGKRLGAEWIQRLFFNGEFFHSDPEKVRVLEMMKGRPEEPLVRYLFITMSINLFPPIVNLDLIIRNREDDQFLSGLLVNLSSM